MTKQTEPTATAAQETKHTPGPWVTKPSRYDGDIGIVATSDESRPIVAECFEDMRTATEAAKDECAANARLIAAAPDLVNALLDVLEFVEDQEDCDIDSDGYHPNEAMSLAMMIRETLGKAGVKT